MPVLNISNFTVSKDNADVVGTDAVFSHQVKRGTLAGAPHRSWIRKEMKNESYARIELLSQEFLRLLIPHQPETLIAEDPKTEVFYILSEEAPGYRDLPEGEAINFTNGTYSGLGEVMLDVMFLQEIDLKNGNIGIDNKNRVIKIDGNWCFAEPDFPHGYKLTPAAIEYLPYPKDYYTYNWLDVVRTGTYQSKSKIVNPGLSNSEQFRAEVNEGLLKICLLPDSYIELFVEQYVPAGASSYSNLLKSRRDELLVSALQNQSFLAYLKTVTAQLTTERVLKQLKTFKIDNAPIILPQYYTGLEHDFEIRRAKLKPAGPPQKVSEPESRAPLINRCKNWLAMIRADIHVKDILLKKHVDNLEHELQHKANHPQELGELKERILSTLEIVNSTEVAAVKKTIKQFRDSSGFFTIGKNKKAMVIEDALYNTPIYQRATIISSAKVTAVQIALATHRHLGKRGVVYKTKDNKINEHVAAYSFKHLRALFKESPKHKNRGNDATSKSSGISL